MKPTGEKQSVKLDWTRLLGFDQASSSGNADSAPKTQDPRISSIGAKIGNKPGVKGGIKLGIKVGTKTGVKAISS